MYFNKKSIFFFIIIFLVLYTPQILSDFLIGIKCGSIKIYYLDQSNKILSYTFNHRDYDGKLMADSIQNNLIDFKLEKNIDIYKFKQYQYLSNKKILNYSTFTSSISYLLKEMIKNQNRELNICVNVSIRNQLNNYDCKGNFIKYAIYKILPTDNIYDISLKHHNSIQKTKNRKYTNKNTTIYDMCSLINVDYIFVSWRDLSTIKTINNNLLIRQSTNNILKKDLCDLINNKKKKSIIMLDYFNDKYIISSIFDFF